MPYIAAVPTYISTYNARELPYRYHFSVPCTLALSVLAPWFLSVLAPRLWTSPGHSFHFTHKITSHTRLPFMASLNHANTGLLNSTEMSSTAALTSFPTISPSSLLHACVMLTCFEGIALREARDNWGATSVLCFCVVSILSWISSSR